MTTTHNSTHNCRHASPPVQVGIKIGHIAATTIHIPRGEYSLRSDIHANMASTIPPKLASFYEGSIIRWHYRSNDDTKQFLLPVELTHRAYIQIPLSPISIENVQRSFKPTK
jgi:hypothetical protein